MSYGKWEIGFGKHRGKRLEDVPAGYLLWLDNQENPPVQVIKYVEMNRRALQEEKKEDSWKKK